MTIAEDKPVKKKPVRVQPQEDYEFTPVISPIFGVLGEKSQPAKTPALKKASPAKSSLGTVISPIYGMDKPQEDKVEEIPDRLDKPETGMKRRTAGQRIAGRAASETAGSQGGKQKRGGRRGQNGGFAEPESV